MVWKKNTTAEIEKIEVEGEMPVLGKKYTHKGNRVEVEYEEMEEKNVIQKNL